MDTVYVALGGNIGDAASTITAAAKAIQALSQVEAFNISRYYLTTPISSIPQNHYVNAVCSFKTSQELVPLFAELQKIEQNLGKGVKSKDAPRVIDLDLIFYGTTNFKGLDANGTELCVPHSGWKNRLFVLLPLLDLTDEVILSVPDGFKKINLKEYVKNFPNPHRETIIVLKENFFRGGDGSKRSS